MKSEQLINDLIKQDESDQLEFKEGVRKEDIGKTICGFLNHEGGQLVIGVSGRKEVIGIKDAEKSRTGLEQYLVQEIVPEAPVMISIENYGDKQLLLIDVWEGSKQPYIFNGSIYYRRGASTIKASSKEISALIHKRQESEVHWERQPALGVELEDLDLEEIRRTIQASKEFRRTKESSNDSLDFLSRYGLYQNGNFTNASVVLFAKNPSRFLPQTRVRAAFLDYGKTGNVFRDDLLLEGNLFQNIDAIQHFLSTHLTFSRRSDSTNWQRTDDSVFRWRL